MGWCVGLRKPAIGEKNPNQLGTSYLISTLSRVKNKMKISGRQVTAARDLLGITQAELAQAAGLSMDTIFSFEAGQTNPYPRSLEKIVGALELRGIEFTNGTGTGVRLDHAKAAAYAQTVAQTRDNSPR